jgi:tRNA nucleotidyltransferase (CCA-adding enzyme)
VDFKNDIKIRFFLARFGEENTWRIFLLKKALLLEKNNYFRIKQLKIEESILKEELKKKYPVKLSDLAITGNDLLKMGLHKGEKIGDILSIVLEKTLINPNINNKAYLMKFVQSMIKQGNGKI